MKKFVKNICALTLCGAMLMSGCSSKLESNFVYPDDYVEKEPTTASAVLKNEDGFTGNVGEVKIEPGDFYAVIRIKDYGDIKIKLFPEGAPYAVQNFIDLANSGYYNGKSFHRVIENFMIQGGSLNGDGTGGNDSKGGSFRNEINTKLRHFYGALCYASAMGENTCQFYIVNEKEAVASPTEQYSFYSELYTSEAEKYSSIRADYDEGSMEYSMVSQYVDYYEDSIDGLSAMLADTDDAVNEKYQDGGVPFLDGGYTVFGQTVEGFEVIDAITAVDKEMGSDGAESKPVEDIIIESVTIMIAE